MSLFLVTPLDVVRVRLQSQTPVIRATTYTSPTSTTAFKELPPNLGVTACCREVFWVGDNAQFCMAGQNIAVPGEAAAADCLVEETQRKNFTSTLDGLRKIARNEGTLSLWRGLSPTLVMAIPANVIYFTGYDWLRFDEHSPINRLVNGSYAPLVAGSVARIAAASVISPIEMFRTRLQATSGTGTNHFKATLRGLHQMTQTHGYSSLWRGLTLTMWRDVPFSGLYWWGYEVVRNSLTDMRSESMHHDILGTTTTSSNSSISRSGADDENQQFHNRQVTQSQQTNAMTFFDSFTAGAVSGAVAALVTTPFDVGKTRQQVFRHSKEESAASHVSSSSSSSSSAANSPPAKHTTTSTSSFTSSSFSKLTSLSSASNAAAASSSQTASSSASKPLCAPPPLRPEQLSIPRFLLHIFREEGLSGLFRGWAARCLKVAPACAIMISSYEVGKKMAGKINEKRVFIGEESETEATTTTTGDGL